MILHRVWEGNEHGAYPAGLGNVMNTEQITTIQDSGKMNIMHSLEV